VSVAPAPDGDVGRVWALSRALTYRAIDQLTSRGLIAPLLEEQGLAGGQRTVFAATDTGHALLLDWLATPVHHLRDLRSELLLKLVLCDLCGVDAHPLLLRQQEVVEHMAAVFGTPAADDVVALWRSEASQAALRFVRAQLDRTRPLR
jgi:PadR family transcriptional regulator AphA